MRKILLVFVGIVATLMLKQAFLLEPSFSRDNIWIIFGAALLCCLGVHNYHLRSKLESPPKDRNLSLRVGMDLKLELKLRGILANEGKLEAIKVCKEETQMGLGEAKKFIDSLEAY